MEPARGSWEFPKKGRNLFHCIARKPVLHPPNANGKHGTFATPLAVMSHLLLTNTGSELHHKARQLKQLFSSSLHSAYSNYPIKDIALGKYKMSAHSCKGRGGGQTPINDPAKHSRVLSEHPQPPKTPPPAPLLIFTADAYVLRPLIRGRRRGTQKRMSRSVKVPFLVTFFF